MVDELIYSELAKSLADSGRFLIRGEATAAYGIVYPALIAPAWALFESVPQAYAAAKAINALVMSLAAVPAYFLARRVLAEPLALVAAALTVAVPSMVYTATLDDGERVLPAVSLRLRWQWCYGSSGRRRCEQRSFSASASSPTSPASRRSRCCRRC